MKSVLTKFNDVISSNFQGQNHEEWVYFFLYNYAYTMLIYFTLQN